MRKRTARYGGLGAPSRGHLYIDADGTDHSCRLRRKNSLFTYLIRIAWRFWRGCVYLLVRMVKKQECRISGLRQNAVLGHEIDNHIGLRSAGSSWPQEGGCRHLHRPCPEWIRGNRLLHYFHLSPLLIATTSGPWRRLVGNSNGRWL